MLPEAEMIRAVGLNCLTLHTGGLEAYPKGLGRKTSLTEVDRHHRVADQAWAQQILGPICRFQGAQVQPSRWMTQPAPIWYIETVRQHLQQVSP